MARSVARPTYILASPVEQIDSNEGTGMRSALVWMPMALSMAIGLSAYVLVPLGGDDHHHGDGGYHEGSEDHDHY